MDELTLKNEEGTGIQKITTKSYNWKISHSSKASELKWTMSILVMPF